MTHWQCPQCQSREDKRSWPTANSSYRTWSSTLAMSKCVGSCSPSLISFEEYKKTSQDLHSLSTLISEASLYCQAVVSSERTIVRYLGCCSRLLQENKISPMNCPCRRLKHHDREVHSSSVSQHPPFATNPTQSIWGEQSVIINC